MHTFIKCTKNLFDGWKIDGHLISSFTHSHKSVLYIISLLCSLISISSFTLDVKLHKISQVISSCHPKINRKCKCWVKYLCTIYDVNKRINFIKWLTVSTYVCRINVSILPHIIISYFSFDKNEN